MKTSPQDLLVDLQRLAEHFFGIPPQWDEYGRLLEGLRTSFRTANSDFDPFLIGKIEAAKRAIESQPRISLPMPVTQTPEDFFEGDYVFHKKKYFVGWINGTTSIKDILEDSASEWEYRVALPGAAKGRRVIASPSNLLLVLRISEAAKFGYNSQCWKCKSPVIFQLQKCPQCNWYRCFNCDSCGCGYRKRKM